LDQPVRPLYISKTAEVYACKIIVEKKIKKEKDDEKANQEKEQKKDDDLESDSNLRKVEENLERLDRLMNEDWEMRIHHLKLYIRQALQHDYRNAKAKFDEIETRLLSRLVAKRKMKLKSKSSAKSQMAETENKKIHTIEIALKIFRNESDYKTECLVRNKYIPKTKEASKYIVGLVDHGTYHVEGNKNVALNQPSSNISELTPVRSIPFEIKSVRAPCPSWEGYEDEFFVAMELADRSLFRAVSSERIAGYDMYKIRIVLEHVSNALRYLHNHNVCHMDLKPRNIVRTMDGNYKLIDFDQAALIGDNADVKKSKACGYWAPEFVSHSCSKALKSFRINSSLDIWSFGVIAFELCSGNRLFSLDLNNDEIQDSRDRFRLSVWSHANREVLSRVFANIKGKTVHDSMIFYAKHLINSCLKGTFFSFSHIYQLKHTHTYTHTGDPNARPSAKDLTQHPFIAGCSSIQTIFNLRLKYHCFVSHAQAEASGEAAALDFTLREHGVYSWRDMTQTEITEKGMRDGVQSSDCFVLFLTESTLSRSWCLKEIGWALDFKKPIIIVVETDSRFAKFEFEKWTSDITTKNTYGSLSVKFKEIPERIRDEICRQHKHGHMIPYRRRGFETRAMTNEILSRMGYKCLPQYVKKPRKIQSSVLILADFRDENARKARDEMIENFKSNFDILEAKDSPSRVIVLLTKTIFESEKCRSLIVKYSRVPMAFVMMQNVGNSSSWSFRGDKAKEGNMHIIRKALLNIEIMEYRSSSRLYEHIAMLREILNRFHLLRLSAIDREGLCILSK
jgi:serine/threonine protein kinase